MLTIGTNAALMGSAERHASVTKIMAKDARVKVRDPFSRLLFDVHDGFHFSSFCSWIELTLV